MKTLFVVIGLLFISPFSLLASHISGGYIHYNCLSNNFYFIEVHLIRDCIGAGSDPSITLNLESSSCNSTSSYTLAKESETFIEYCTIQESETICQNGNLPGFFDAVYSTVIELPPFECNDWRLSVNQADANILDFISNTGTITLQTFFDNTGGYCGANPRFNDDSFIYSCFSINSDFNTIANDPDGNNGLEYFLTCPIIGGTSNLSFTFPGGSCQNPFPNSSGGFNLDQQTGNMNFTPDVIGKSMLSYVVEESDANGIVRSRTFRTLQIFSSNCQGTNTPNITSNPTILKTYSGGEICFTLVAESPGGVNNFFITDLPNSIIQNSSNQGNIFSLDICYNPSTVICDVSQSISFNAFAISSATGCLAQSSVEKEIEILLSPPKPCKSNIVVTNVNTTIPPNQQSTDMMTGLAYYGAENEIWVGDGGFPLQYLTAGISPGSVYFDFPVFFEAGTAVTLPSCQTGTSCVNLTAGSTIRINPGHCSPECIEPIEICANEVFECNGEKIDVLVKGGVPPFHVYVYIEGNYAGDKPGLSNHDENTPIEVDISNAVNNYDGQIEYYVLIEDVTGDQFVTPPMDLLGTKRFYEPIENNMISSPFDPNNDPKYLVDPIVDPGISQRPAIVWDDVNTSAPYYGATWFELLIFDRWGGIVLDLEKDLEGTSIWSLDNGEIHWNGYFNNDQGSLCTYNTSTPLFPAILKAKNCASAGVYIDNFNDLQGPFNEPGHFVVDAGCYSGSTNDWIPRLGINGTTEFFNYIPAGNFGDPSSDPGYICHLINSPSGMMLNNQNHQQDNLIAEIYLEETSGVSGDKNLRSRRQVDFNQKIVDKFAGIEISPNPFLNEITINGFSADIQSIRVFDTKQTLVKVAHPVRKNINLSNLESGVYVIIVTMKNKQEKAFRIVKL